MHEMYASVTLPCYQYLRSGDGAALPPTCSVNIHQLILHVSAVL